MSCASQPHEETGPHLVEEEADGAGEVDPAPSGSYQVWVEERDGEDVERDGREADEGYSVGCEPWR